MPDAPITLGTWRCAKCGRILARVNIVDGHIEIKCKCNHVSTWQLSHRIDVQPMR